MRQVVTVSLVYLLLSPCITTLYIGQSENKSTYFLISRCVNITGMTCNEKFKSYFHEMKNKTSIYSSDKLTRRHTFLKKNPFVKYINNLVYEGIYYYVTTCNFNMTKLLFNRHIKTPIFPNFFLS